MIRYIEDINNRDDEYLDYLKNHIEGVQQTWKDIFVPIFRRMSTKQFDEYSELIQKHDESKYSKEEWDAYLNYFYPDENHPKDDNAFDLAWLHHLHNNPHHWQYWILQRDNGEQVPLDMPEKYVIEMLCDWMSFSKKNPEFQNEYKNFKKCLSEINNYFEKISNDNNIKNNKIDTTLIDTKKEYLDNYVFNAIVNHANYYYKSKKKNHINEDKIIEEIILNDYLKNKKKSRFNILKNYLSNSNPKSKFKNRYQVENAIRKINDEMEDALKEFSKLFQNNEKDYN